MLRHVVLFRWKDGTTDEQVAAIADGLSGLPAAIPEIAGYRFGRDAGLVEGNFDFGIVADFADEADWLVYRQHPVHLAVIAERITDHVDTRAAVQYEFASD